MKAPSLRRTVPDRLLVKFRIGTESASAQTVHQQAGGSVIKIIPRINVHVVKVEELNIARVMAAYRASPLVEFVENDAYVYAAVDPNDPLYPQQWHYPAISLPAAWNMTTGPNCVIVAVVDTGIRPHEDLSWVAGYDFFENDADPTDTGCPNTNPNNYFSHGMHVAGTIAALTDNGRGVAGVNWRGVQIMPIRVLGELGPPFPACATGFVSMVADGIVYAMQNGAKIINISLAGPASMALENAVNNAYAAGVTLVAAAGNENRDISTASYPAGYQNVIAVGATECNNLRASYSNFGVALDLMAPGGDALSCHILSTSWSQPGQNGYYSGSGTSFAAPHVSGVAALLIARGFTGPVNIQNRLQSTATDLGAPGPDPLHGHGLVNAAAAVGP